MKWRSGRPTGLPDHEKNPPVFVFTDDELCGYFNVHQGLKKVASGDAAHLNQVLQVPSIAVVGGHAGRCQLTYASSECTERIRYKTRFS
jgi:hypothetical protein